MAVTQDTFEILRNVAYAGMPATGRYQNIDGSQLVSGKVTYGAPVSMGTKSRTVEEFDPTRPFGGIVTRNFYMGSGAIGEDTNRPFDAEEKHWDLDTGLFGDWWVPVSNDVENGQPATITPDGEWAGGLIVGNFLVTGATYRSEKTTKGLVWVELTGSRILTPITAAVVKSMKK